MQNSHKKNKNKKNTKHNHLVEQSLKLRRKHHHFIKSNSNYEYSQKTH